MKRNMTISFYWKHAQGKFIMNAMICLFEEKNLNSFADRENPRGICSMQCSVLAIQLCIV